VNDKAAWVHRKPRHFVNLGIPLVVFALLFYANRHAQDLGLEDRNVEVIPALILSALPSVVVFWWLWWHNRKNPP